MVAIIKKNVEIIKRSIKTGADGNYKNNFNEIILQIAEQKGFTEIADILKSVGAKEEALCYPN